ncbi:NADH:ubiquinone reductase (H(+)-translocating) [Ranunculus cassubicifolius]
MKRSFSTVMATDENPTGTRRGTPFPCIQIFRDFAQSGNAKDKNFVFSPLSIQLAISLIANGATGSTLEVLLNFLEAENQDQLKSHASKLISALTESGNEALKLSFLGGMWINQSNELVPNFKTDAETMYKAKAEAVDFKHNAKEIEKTLNQWAAESTNGLIDSLVPKDSIDESTQLVLANALYFKGKWSDKFLKSLTRELEFYLLGGSTVEVPFMRNMVGSQFIKTCDSLKVLRLPYRESSLSMYILLPHARDGLWPLVEKVGSDPLFLDQCTDPTMPAVRVGRFLIPKFKIDYEFEASNVLKAMGLGLCFADKAEFNEMVIGGGIKVQNVYHRSHIEVEEEGTQAAARTAVRMRSTGGLAPRKQPPVVLVNFVADHPFMYMVRDDVNRMVLFMGHVLNPLC